MRIKWKPIIIGFFVFYFFVYALTSCSALKADEPEKVGKPELNCETFINEKICNMTPAEQETFFLEMFKALIDQKLNENEVESVDICLKETEEGKFIPCKGMDI